MRIPDLLRLFKNSFLHSQLDIRDDLKSSMIESLYSEMLLSSKLLTYNSSLFILESYLWSLDPTVIYEYDAQFCDFLASYDSCIIFRSFSINSICILRIVFSEVSFNCYISITFSSSFSLKFACIFLISLSYQSYLFQDFKVSSKF